MENTGKIIIYKSRGNVLNHASYNQYQILLSFKNVEVRSFKKCWLLRWYTKDEINEAIEHAKSGKKVILH